MCVPSVGLEFVPFSLKMRKQFCFSNVQIDKFYMIIACEYIE